MHTHTPTHTHTNIHTQTGVGPAADRKPGPTLFHPGSMSTHHLNVIHVIGLKTIRDVHVDNSRERLTHHSAVEHDPK